MGRTLNAVPPAPPWAQQVSAQPDVFVLDTPGVMQRRIATEDDALKLSLAGEWQVAV